MIPWILFLSTFSAVMASQERKRKNSAPALTSNKVSKTSAIAKPGSSKRVEGSEVDLILSQTNNNTDHCSLPDTEYLCGVCKQPTSSDTIQVTSLQCCLCKLFFHGACLDINNTSLLDFLYVVTEIGGWCCVSCRQPSKPAKPNRGPKVTLNAEQVNDELQLIKAQLASISDCLHSTPINAGVSFNCSNKGLTYAQVAGSIPASSYNVSQLPVSAQSTLPSLDQNTRTAVLTAVHSEMNLKSQRSNNIVVTGLPISKFAPDIDQFMELCEREFDIRPKVRSTVRLGNPIDGRTQPLLVCMESSDEVEGMMNVARNLRNSDSRMVRDRIFINRHLTKAEAAAAFRNREERRRKEKERMESSNNMVLLPIPSPASDTTTFTVPIAGYYSDAAPPANTGVIPPPPPPPPPFHRLA